MGEIKEQKDREKEQMIQWNEAKDMQDRLCLYEIVWDRIYGTKE